MSALKDRIVIMPTPTTWPSPIWLVVRARLAGLAMVVNFAVVLAPPAVTVAVYSVAYLSCLAGTHSVGAPACGAPWIAVPSASCSVTVEPGAGASNVMEVAVETSRAPSAGVVTLAVPPGAALEPPLPPFQVGAAPQPVSSRALATNGRVSRRSRIGNRCARV